MSKRKIVLSVALVFAVLMCLVVTRGIYLLVIYYEPSAPQEECPPLVYDASDVLSVCQAFTISDEDEFCANPSSQNVETLEEMLNRNYPVREANYDDLAFALQVLPARPSSFCERVYIEGYPVFAENNCPPPEQCEQDYSCSVILPGSIVSVSVHIEYPSGMIRGYVGSRSGISSDPAAPTSTPCAIIEVDG